MAERQTILQVQAITDHSCGNYQIGEIDTLPDEAIRQHILEHGEYGYEEWRDFGIRILTMAEHFIRNKRMESQLSTSNGSST